MSAKEYSTFGTPPRGKLPSELHPHATASWLSKILLTWVNPIISLGNKKQLDENDTWPLQQHHQSAVVSVNLARSFTDKQSIPRAFLACFGWRFAISGLAYFVAAATTLAGPLVLKHVVSELSAGEYDVDDLAQWIVALLAMQLLEAFMDNYARFDSEVMAIQFTGALKNMLYHKTLRLSAESRKETSTGDITNIYTTDCDMIPAIAYMGQQLWIMPAKIVAVSVLLYRVLGPASLAGYGVIALVFITNQFIALRVYALYMAFMKAKDARLKVVTEAFKSVTIAKFNAWEDSYLERIATARALEVNKIWTFMKFNAMSVVLTWGIPVFISAASFSVYTGVMHKQLTPSIVFTSIALFQQIVFPLRMIPSIIGVIVQGKGSLDRVQAFLCLPELDDNTVLSIDSPDADAYVHKNIIVAMENATLTWGRDISPVLQCANLGINGGEFVVVHGPVGCGKSSLCSALIGDMVKTEGKLYVGGSVAYCSQQPWIQHATVRDNILFGRPFDRKKYDKVVEACALTADLKSLPVGDRTEIGERGVNLSGGQKARVALARACYSDASVYILDAPLAAVDAIVQNEIFQKCLLGLLRHRTVILVTHNADIIASEHVTRAITINSDGAIVETRTTTGMRPDYQSLVTPLAASTYTKKTYEEVSLNLASDQHEETDESRARQAELQELTDLSIGLKSPLKPTTQIRGYDDDDHAGGHDSKLDSETHRLVADEERSKGRVGFFVFKSYYNAIGGFPILSIVIMSQILWQGFQISSDFWVKDWSMDAAAAPEDTVSTRYRIQVYALLGVLAAFMVMIRTWTVSFMGLRAAKNLFNRMTYSLMHAPMKFFDANPVGRIMTRYTEDTTSVDISVPLSFGAFFANLFSVGCSLVTTLVIIRWNGIMLLPIVAIYTYVGHVYLQPAREVERVMRTSEAPLLSFLNETIEGSSSIRAFGRNEVRRFEATNNHKLDTTNKVWFARLAISQWFSLRIQLLGAVLVFVVAFSLMSLHKQLSAAVVGLAFTYILKVSGNMEMIIQAWSGVETSMVSPERIQQFIDVEQEAPHKIAQTDPSKADGWPTKGSIRFDHVDFRYKKADRLVLSNISFAINSGEKIGIVGRTGAGKSSLTMALFRINELASGTISIDGVDISKIGLKTLREKMSIIPQNPVLFNASLRKNLDPFDNYTDDQLWDCIRRVGLHDRITSEEDKLDYVVEENGENFSVGERQMLCMARALLRKSRIVIFDEATAAIDHETDKKLQRVIREAFANSTVLTIAHRLDTILDSDRILVLDGGSVVEFASPSELVTKGKGHFFDLMQEGGYLDKFMQGQQPAA